MWKPSHKCGKVHIALRQRSAFPWRVEARFPGLSKFSGRSNKYMCHPGSRQSYLKSHKKLSFIIFAWKNQISPQQWKCGQIHFHFILLIEVISFFKVFVLFSNMVIPVASNVKRLVTKGAKVQVWCYLVHVSEMSQRVALSWVNFVADRTSEGAISVLIYTLWNQTQKSHCVG